MANLDTKLAATDRYLIAKDYKRVDGRQVWGVYDTVTKRIVESGFFSKGAAILSAVAWNRTEGR